MSAARRSASAVAICAGAVGATLGDAPAPTRPRSWTWAAALCLAALVGTTAAPNGCQGSAMGKMVIFSAVSGRVLQDGKPVAGAVVEREFRWVWGKETGKDSTTTGPGGEFTLPKIERSSFLGSLLPHEPVVRQTLTIRHGGKEYEGWLFHKHSYGENDEAGGKPLRLVCRLDAAPAQHPAGFYGICELE